jgi:hypothetical protein
MSTQPPPVNWADLLKLLSPDGQRQIVDFVRRAQEERGSGWLDEIKVTFPLASWIFELVCTRTADEALDDVAAAYPKWPIRIFAGESIRQLHAKLKLEIERPRNL